MSLGVAGDLTTLQRLGEIAVQLVDSLSLDQDHRVVNLTGITRLMNTISKGSVHLEQQTDSSLSLVITSKVNLETSHQKPIFIQALFTYIIIYIDNKSHIKWIFRTIKYIWQSL